MYEYVRKGGNETHFANDWADIPDPRYLGVDPETYRALVDFYLP